MFGEGACSNTWSVIWVRADYNFLLWLNSRESELGVNGDCAEGDAEAWCSRDRTLLLEVSLDAPKSLGEGQSTWETEDQGDRWCERPKQSRGPRWNRWSWGPSRQSWRPWRVRQSERPLGCRLSGRPPWPSEWRRQLRCSTRWRGTSADLRRASWWGASGKLMEMDTTTWLRTRGEQMEPEEERLPGKGVRSNCCSRDMRWPLWQRWGTERRPPWPTPWEATSVSVITRLGPPGPTNLGPPDSGALEPPDLEKTGFGGFWTTGPENFGTTRLGISGNSRLETVWTTEHVGFIIPPLPPSPLHQYQCDVWNGELRMRKSKRPQGCWGNLNLDQGPPRPPNSPDSGALDPSDS